MSGKNVIDDVWFHVLIGTGKNVIDDEDIWFHVLIGTGKNVIDDEDLWFHR